MKSRDVNKRYRLDFGVSHLAWQWLMRWEVRQEFLLDFVDFVFIEFHKTSGPRDFLSKETKKNFEVKTFVGHLGTRWVNRKNH